MQWLQKIQERKADESLILISNLLAVSNRSSTFRTIVLAVELRVQVSKPMEI